MWVPARRSSKVAIGSVFLILEDPEHHFKLILCTLGQFLLATQFDLISSGGDDHFGEGFAKEIELAVVLSK